MTQGKLPLTTALRTDLAKIAALVNERHGIVIPPDDPAWAIVTMNELPALALRNETLRMIDKLMAARIAELRTVLAHAEKRRLGLQPNAWLSIRIVWRRTSRSPGTTKSTSGGSMKRWRSRIRNERRPSRSQEH